MSKRSIELPVRDINERCALTNEQLDFLDCYILGMSTCTTMFQMMFAVGKSKAVAKSLMQSLLNCSDAKEYMRDRKTQLEKHYFGGMGNDDETTGVDMAEMQKIIYEKVSSDLVSDLKAGAIDYKSSTIIEKFMQKALDFDADKTNAPEPPRIYLPESCMHCRYRLFCESDNVVDECPYCKYRKFAIEHGVEYDHKNQLEIPQENES